MKACSRFAVCIGGIPGAGKTTLLRKHVELEVGDMQVTGSSIIKQIITPSSMHELDSWTSEQRQTVREQSIRELRRLQNLCTGRMLVDGHFTLRNRVTGVLEPIFTSEDKAFFQALILIHPKPELVLARRESDWRVRRSESIVDVVEHIEFELHEGRRLARDMEVPLLELVESGMSQKLHAMAEFLNKIAPLGAR